MISSFVRALVSAFKARHELVVLRAGLRGKRLRLSDDDRRRLAVKAQALGREALVCLLFIHPRAPNLINLRSAGTMPA